MAYAGARMWARAATDIKVVWDSCLWDSDRWDGWEAQAHQAKQTPCSPSTPFADSLHAKAAQAIEAIYEKARQPELFQAIKAINDKAINLELEAARPRPPATPPTSEQIRRLRPDYLQQPPAPKRMRVVPSPVLGYLSDQEYTVYYYARYTVWRNF